MTKWRNIQEAIEQLHDAGKTLPVWWRDDDAIELTPALLQLESLAERYQIPVHLAIIPASARRELAAALTQNMIAVTHGLSHQNRAPDGSKKAEFSDVRPKRELSTDLQAGSDAMAALGIVTQPMFVPPWNRIGVSATDLLPSFGYRYLSTYNARPEKWAAPGLERVNTHVDPIDWHETRSLVDEDQLLARLQKDLDDRLSGATDATEPFGLLTHHLAHDGAIWDFTDQFLEVVLSAPVTLWQADKKDTTDEQT
ncbi:MAG: polysaccharide deacetylase family protein [Pseudomonadota bacterium]